MRYQQLSGGQLPDFIKLIAVVNGLNGSVKNFVLLHLDRDSSFSDLDSLLATYVDIDRHEYSLESFRESIDKGNSKEPNPNFEHQLEEGGQRQEGKRKAGSKPNKATGEAYPPSPPAYKGKGKHAQLPTRQRWRSICRKKGTRPKLAGGMTITSNNTSSTNNNKFGIHQALRGQQRQQKQLPERGLSLRYTT